MLQPIIILLIQVIYTVTVTATNDCNANHSDSFNLTVLPNEWCGDSIIQAVQGEQCEGTDFDGKDCTDYGFTGGTPGCLANCFFDISNCCNDGCAGRECGPDPNNCWPGCPPGCGSHAHCTAGQCVCDAGWPACDGSKTDADGCECYTGGSNVCWSGSCCTPATTCAANWCGTHDDGCGGTIDCGICVNPNIHCSAGNCVCNVGWSACDGEETDADGCECNTGSGDYQCIGINCSSICQPFTYGSQIYDVVMIGEQCWMAKNLNTIHDANGTAITRYCYDDAVGCGGDYGGLYSWYTAVSCTGDCGTNQGICPDGWHIPTDTEFKTLVEGQATAGCESSFGWQCSPAGTALKSGGSSGFEGLLVGYRLLDTGEFLYRGTRAIFWSCDPFSVNAWNRYLNSFYATVTRNYYDKGHGFSVRCLKD